MSFRIQVRKSHSNIFMPVPILISMRFGTVPVPIFCIHFTHYIRNKDPFRLSNADPMQIHNTGPSKKTSDEGPASRVPDPLVFWPPGSPGSRSVKFCTDLDTVPDPGLIC
jgi:hypothetical protein